MVRIWGFVSLQSLSRRLNATFVVWAPHCRQVACHTPWPQGKNHRTSALGGGRVRESGHCRSQRPGVWFPWWEPAGRWSPEQVWAAGHRETVHSGHMAGADCHLMSSDLAAYPPLPPAAWARKSCPFLLQSHSSAFYWETSLLTKMEKTIKGILPLFLEQVLRLNVGLRGKKFITGVCARRESSVLPQRT